MESSISISRFKWRSRFTILTGVNLELGDYPFVDNTLIRIIEWPDTQSNFGDLQIRMLELYLLEDLPIEEAVVLSHDLVDIFLDRISLLGYCFAKQMDFISTCPARVAIGEEFELADCRLFFRRLPVKVTPPDILTFEERPSSNFESQMLRLLRKAMMANSVEEQLLNLYATLERVAEEKAPEIVTSCSECNHPVRKAKGTGKYIKQELSQFNISGKDAETIRDHRNMIAHGGGVRDQSRNQKFKETISKLEKAAVSIACRENNVSVIKSVNATVGLPIIVHLYKKNQENDFKFISTKLEAKVGLSEISECKDKREHYRHLSFGLEHTPEKTPIIHPFAFPE